MTATTHWFGLTPVVAVLVVLAIACAVVWLIRNVRVR